MLLLAWAAGAQSTRYGVDLSGAPVSELAHSGTRVVVLFFVASDCPLSNRYDPEVARLQRVFADRGVQFWWVYPNPGDTASVVSKHMEQFNEGPNVVLDTEQALVHMARATVTPEAAVFLRDSNGLHEVYRGRIDDRYLAFGSERPQAQHHNLEDALTDTLNNQAIPPPGGPPVGCAIVTRKP